MGKGHGCNGGCSKSVAYAGGHCLQCTSNIFFQGRPKKDLTVDEKVQFKIHQVGKENVVKRQKSTSKYCYKSKVTSIKMKKGIKLNSVEEGMATSRKRGNERHYDISKNVTIKQRNGTILNLVEEGYAISRERHCDIQKSVTIKQRNGTALNLVEEGYAISRERYCNIFKSIATKQRNGTTLDTVEEGYAISRKRYLNAGRDRRFEIGLQASRDREAEVGGQYKNKTWNDIGSTLASILIKGSTTVMAAGSLFFNSCLPTSRKELEYMVEDSKFSEHQQANINRGFVNNIIPLYVMNLFVLYMFLGYYNKENLDRDREKYRTDFIFRLMWSKISCHYDDAGKDIINYFLFVGDSELSTLIDLLEHTFGKVQIQAFGRNFDKDHTKFRSISELLLYASVYIGESRRPLTVEDLRWIIAYGVYQGNRYFPNLMRPAGYSAVQPNRHRINRAELRDPNHLHLRSRVISVPFPTRAVSRRYEGILHHLLVPYYMGMLHLPIHQVQHRITLWKRPSMGAYFHPNDAPHTAAGGTYYCFATYSDRIPQMIDNGTLEFNDRDIAPNAPIQ